eukprot:GHVN01059295.1.p1 GENE.GHVN01059295.1~~GHVN01059295.1.p1  ORF type:complete len:705 (+),score=70.37 GHVN01059295.1:3570-5684(+)
MVQGASLLGNALKPHFNLVRFRGHQCTGLFRAGLVLTRCRFFLGVPPGFENFPSIPTRVENRLNKETKRKQGSSGSSSSNYAVRLVIGAIGGGSLLWGWSRDRRRTMTQQDLFTQYLATDLVQCVKLANGHAMVTVSTEDGGSQEIRVPILSPHSFERKLDDYQDGLGINLSDRIPVTYAGGESDGITFGRGLAVLSACLLVIVMVKRGALPKRERSFRFPGGSAIPGGKGDTIKPTKSNVKFKEIAGMKNSKLECEELIEFLKTPKKFHDLGAKIPKGVLLVGPPGTGKTLLAKALAREADVPFFQMPASQFIEIYIGTGPRKVRQLFKTARENAPSIVFIDEIDALGKRGRRGTGERDNTINALLSEMDGFDELTDVVVLATTNRAEMLDEALLRSGRMDRKINVPLPDMDGRDEIFQIYLKKLRLGPEIPLHLLSGRSAALTPGFSGADIKNACNEAAIFAARRNSPYVQAMDLDEGITKVRQGPKSSKEHSPKMLETVSIHEAGHVVVGWFLEHAHPQLNVTVIPRGGVHGSVQNHLDEKKMGYRRQLEDSIAVLLGGRAAEELELEDVSVGAASDLEKAAKVARTYVAELGMSPQMGVVFHEKKSTRDSTAQSIDEQVMTLVNTQYEHAKSVLREHREELLSLARALKEKKTLNYAEIVEVLGERPAGQRLDQKLRGNLGDGLFGETLSAGGATLSVEG